MMAVAKSLLALALVSRCCGASNATAPKATEANATRSWRSSGCGKAPPVAPGAPATKLSMWAPDGNPLFPSGYAANVEKAQKQEQPRDDAGLGPLVGDRILLGLEWELRTT